MPPLRAWRLRSKWVFVLALMASVLLFAHAMVYLYQSFMEGRKEAVRNVVEVAHAILQANHQLELEGRLTRAEAQRTSIGAIRMLRYSGNEYFWINDMQPRMVMHPTRPSLDGQDLSDYADPQGKRLFVAFVDRVREHGGGFVNYQWPKPGDTRPVRKISYVMGFEPWGWIIGSGMYTDDMEATFLKEFLQNAGLLLVVAALLLLLARRAHYNIEVDKTLRASEARLRRVVENLPVAAVIASGEKTFLVNRRFTQLFGYELADVPSLAEWWPRAFPDPAYGEMATRQWWQQVADTLDDKTGAGVICEYRITAKDGSERVVELSYCQSDEWAVISFYDLTERKFAEAHQRLTARVFDTTGEAILVTDTQARIIAVNPAFCRITGYAREEVLGKNPNILNSGRHDKAFHQGIWNSLLETGEWAGEVWNRRKDGEVFPEWQTISSVRDGEGRITHYVAVFADLSEIRRAQATAEQLTSHDPLTGLANRESFLCRLEDALRDSLAGKTWGATVLIDLDRFKDINEARGFSQGDALLKTVAEHCLAQLKAEDLLARLSSDEFAVLLPAPLPNAAAAGRAALAVAEKLRAILRNELTIGEERFELEGSVGIAVFPQHEDEVAADVMRQADMAMHRAKAEGGARTVFFEKEMGEAVIERYALERELRAAVAAEQLRLYLQPQVDAAGQVVGAEALVRWQHPARGLVPPGVFIPLAEATDLIVAVDRWMLAHICELLPELERRGSSISISVNISARHFQKADFVEEVERQLQRTGARPQHLVLEITESLVIGDLAAVVGKMVRLRALGLRISMDDFGTGYSSLAYLKRLPIQELKIDKSFISDATEDASDAALVETIIAVARHLGLSVVAEGVETAAQAEFLNRQGEVIHQGYLFGRPIPAAEWLAGVERR